MTRDFRAALKALGLTGRGFAMLTAVHEETVTGWGRARHRRGVQDVPRWAWLLIDAWTACPEALEAARGAPRVPSGGAQDLARAVPAAPKRWSGDIAA